MNGLSAGLQSFNIHCLCRSSSFPFFFQSHMYHTQNETDKYTHFLASMLWFYLRKSDTKQGLALGTTERVASATRCVNVSMYLRIRWYHLNAHSQPLKWNKLPGESCLGFLFSFIRSIAGTVPGTCHFLSWSLKEIHRFLCQSDFPLPKGERGGNKDVSLLSCS